MVHANSSIGMVKGKILSQSDNKQRQVSRINGRDTVKFREKSLLENSYVGVLYFVPQKGMKQLERLI